MTTTFDTNVFVSGLTHTQGRAAQALGNIVAGLDLLFVSRPIIEELRRVLAEKFGWTDVDLVEVDNWFSNHARLVVPTETINILADEPDNRILECAVAANADAIVTGDRQMLALGNFRNIPILALADYLGSVDNSLVNS